MSQPIPLSVYRGESKTYRFTVVDVDTGDRVNLTGATIDFTIKAADGAGAALLAKAIGSGITLRDQTDPAQRGQFDVVLPYANTQALAAAKYRYDCAVREVSGFRFYASPAADFYVIEAVNSG